MLLFLPVFVFFSRFLLNQGQIMYIQMLYATDKPSGMLTWNKQFLGDNNKKKKKLV